jgi:hypothetical protein
MELLKKVYLDWIFRESLERIALDEGWINSEIDENAVDALTMPRQMERHWLRKKTLILITLFNEVDSSYTGLNWSKFIDEGIVSAKATMLDHSEQSVFYDKPENLIGPMQYERERLVSYSRESSREILRIFKNRFIQFHYQNSLPNFYTRNARLFVTKEDLVSEFDWLLDNIDDGQIIGKKPHLSAFEGDMESMIESLEKCIYFSSYERVAFTTGLGDSQEPEPLPTVELIDNLYYLVKTNLTNEVLILPEPRSISEAIEMRNAKEMKKFREILSEWLSALVQGDVMLEKNIRRDIQKANIELEKLKHWRQFEKSPLNFWLNSIGGQIPYFSNILSAFNSVAGLYSTISEKNNSWVLFAQKKKG